jgi:hypothetical protein
VSDISKRVVKHIDSRMTHSVEEALGISLDRVTGRGEVGDALSRSEDIAYIE